MNIILVVLLVILLCGGSYGYRAGYYSAPAFGGGTLGLVLVVLLVIWLLGGVR